MSVKNLPENQHNIEIHSNLDRWYRKPVLQKIYREFYNLIATYLNRDIDGKIVELGSGIGNMKMVIPEVICTDIFKNPWIDQVENAYDLSFEDDSLSNIILFDVWHHLKFPGTALAEFHRVLKKDGHIIVFEPGMGLLGKLVFGLFHHEPIAASKEILWFSTGKDDPVRNEYYAAQGNASRIFCSAKYVGLLHDWKIVKIRKLSALSYVLSGVYSKHQLYPDKFLPILKFMEKIFDLFTRIFATRLLVVI